MIIADTCLLLAFFKSDDADHAAARTVMAAHRGEVIVSPLVVAELGYLVQRHLGVQAEIDVVAELAEGDYDIPLVSGPDLAACGQVLQDYADLAIGITDATLVILADRYNTHRIGTFDRRHFTALRGLDGRPFELLP